MLRPYRLSSPVQTYVHGIRRHLHMRPCKALEAEIPFFLQDQTIILPEFIELLSSTICRTSNLEIYTNCMNHMYIPPLNDQIIIVDNMIKIAKNLDVSPDITGVILRLMLNQDSETLVALLDALESYQSSFQLIKSIQENTIANTFL